MRTDHQQQSQELEAHVLWVAKQHGHSIVTMLRIYAAWAEGAVEADVETIKRSMNLTSIRRESLALNNLAVDLSVAEGIHRLGAFAFAVSGVPGHTLSGCFDIRKTAKSWIVSYGWGGRIRIRMAGSNRYMDQHNQQVTDTTAWLAPLRTLPI